MEFSRTLLFIVADENTNAGERDSMMAIARELETKNLPGTQMIFCKRSNHIEHSDKAASFNTLPFNTTLYRDIPYFEPSVLDSIATQNVHVIGVGNTTLTNMLRILPLLKSMGKTVQADYITHMINNHAHLQELVEHAIRVFTPASRASVLRIDPALAAQLQLVELDGIPHTHTKKMIMPDYLKLMETENGRILQSLLDKNEPFAFAVTNAGSGVGETDIHVPYREDEATLHGAALGDYLPGGTHLVLAHGGARNIVDIELFNQDSMAAFATAYRTAQQRQGGDPVILFERFAPDLHYNAVKASYILGQNPLCLAYISNAEGYGTMDGAILHLDNRKLLLGMFPFDALNEDKTEQREDNTAKYHHLGMAILGNENGHLKITRHPEERHTPIEQRNAAEQIVSTLI